MSLYTHTYIHVCIFMHFPKFISTTCSMYLMLLICKFLGPTILKKSSLLFTVLNIELTAKIPSEFQAVALLFAWVPSCIGNAFLLV